MIGFKGIQMLASVRAADRMQEHFSRFEDYFEAQLEDGKLEDSGMHRSRRICWPIRSARSKLSNSEGLSSSYFCRGILYFYYIFNW